MPSNSPPPSDPFEDENAPPIPQLGDVNSGGDISDEARQRAQQDAAKERRTPETQAFIDTAFGGGGGGQEMSGSKSDFTSGGASFESSPDESGSPGELLEEVRQIRSLLESILNS
jgi:hypothetical protein